MALVKLHITQDLIDTARTHQQSRTNAAGVCYSITNHCVTARALTLALGCPVDMYPRNFYINLTKGTRKPYKLPRSLQRIQVAFDNGKEVKPQTLNILLREYKS